MTYPDFSHENDWSSQNHGYVAGVDEAGRGPLAGPVCAAAVILDPSDIPDGLNDSKMLSAKTRVALFEAIMTRALATSIAMIPAGTIDRINIRAAALLAMSRAVASLSLRPAHVLVDGRDTPPNLACPARTIIGGDGKSLSIAAASIVAKVTRDRLMQRLDIHAPHFGFAAHSGYATSLHRKAIAAYGPGTWHRLSFAPMRETTSDNG